jgi:urease accessory protein
MLMTDTALSMLTRRLRTAARIDAVAALTLEQRVRSRQRVRLDDGREAGISLPRGDVLKDGDLLATDDGSLTVRIVAAPECVSVAACDDPVLLARACYHLGNRHVALQIEPGRLCWLHDHVLDAMVRGLGLAVAAQDAPFEPEPGAYGGQAAGQTDGHAHAHGHGHAHHH